MTASTPTLHITVGIPASGKSTWAREWAAEESVTPRTRVNRDDTRTYLGLTHGQNEGLVSEVQQQTVRNCLSLGHDVVVDDTNLVPRFAKEWLKIAAQFRAKVVWHDEFLKVDVRTCIDRDRDRDAKVGVDVIMKMAERAKQWKRPVLNAEPDLSIFESYHGTPGMPKAFLVDLDGTIASNGVDRDHPNRGYFDWHRVGEDLPVKVIIEVVRHFRAQGLLPLFVSGRDAVCYKQTREWIIKHVWDDGPGPTYLFMRPENDNRKDSIVKLEIFNDRLRDNFDVQFALDDRDQVVKAYRDILGLTVLQVAEGAF